MEVLYGVHDHWVNPKEGKWEYTYHQRLFEYDCGKCQKCRGGGHIHIGKDGEFDIYGRSEVCSDCDGSGRLKIDQIAKCVEMLKKCGFTRRAQAITWQPWEDLGISDPACLQRLWFRVQNGKLNMTISIRSNDAFKAGFMNMYAFTELQALVASMVGVEPGEYVHYADSFHVYGSYFDEFEGVLKTVGTRPVEERVLATNGCIPGTTERVMDFFVEGCDKLLSEADMPEEKKEIVKLRRSWLLNKIAQVSPVQSTGM
jgi:thymidylate synthase